MNWIPFQCPWVPVVNTWSPQAREASIRARQLKAEANRLSEQAHATHAHLRTLEQTRDPDWEDPLGRREVDSLSNYLKLQLAGPARHVIGRHVQDIKQIKATISGPVSWPAWMLGDESRKQAIRSWRKKALQAHIKALKAQRLAYQADKIHKGYQKEAIARQPRHPDDSQSASEASLAAQEASKRTTAYDNKFKSVKDYYPPEVEKTIQSEAKQSKNELKNSLDTFRDEPSEAVAHHSELAEAHRQIIQGLQKRSHWGPVPESIRLHLQAMQAHQVAAQEHSQHLI